MSDFRSLAVALTVGLLACGAASAASPTALEEKATLPDGRTFSVWLGGSLLDAPVTNGLGTVGDTAGFLFLQQTDGPANLPTLGLSGGIEGWFPTEKFLMFGELEGDVAHGSTSSQTTIGQNGTYVDILPLNGQVSPGAILSALPAGTAINSATTIDYSRVTATLGGGLPGQGPVKLATGVLLSVAGTHLQSTVSDVTGASYLKLDESVSMQSTGPVLAAQWDAALNDKTSVGLGGRVGVLVAHGTLTASETSTRTGTNASSSATASAYALAAIAEGDGTLNYAVSDKLIASVTGGVGVRNDYFSIVNPRSGSGLTANSSASYHPGAASLQQAALLSAKITVGLNGGF